MSYYLEKVLNLVRKLTMRSADGVVYTNSPKDIKWYDAIFFYFNYPKLMHLGDHLYFKPLISKLHKNGHRVIVDPVENIKFAFQDHLISKNSSIDFQKVLFVSRLELMPEIISKFGAVDYFLYDSMSRKINLPISNFIVNSFFKHYRLDGKLDLSITADDYLDFVVVPYDKFGLGAKSNVIFFSNYVDSGKFRVSRRSGDRLLAGLLKERGDSYVVHLGTKRDVLDDCNKYSDIVDLDLRGLTTPEDIFSLMAMRNIRAVYCYDTFILHVANIFDIKVNVIFKKYFLCNQQKRQAFSSLFVKEDSSNIILMKGA